MGLAVLGRTGPSQPRPHCMHGVLGDFGRSLMSCPARCQRDSGQLARALLGGRDKPPATSEARPAPRLHKAWVAKTLRQSKRAQLGFCLLLVQLPRPRAQRSNVQARLRHFGRFTGRPGGIWALGGPTLLVSCDILPVSTCMSVAMSHASPPDAFCMCSGEALAWSFHCAPFP